MHHNDVLANISRARDNQANAKRRILQRATVEHSDLTRER